MMYFSAATDRDLIAADSVFVLHGNHAGQTGLGTGGYVAEFLGSVWVTSRTSRNLNELKVATISGTEFLNSSRSDTYVFLSDVQGFGQRFAFIGVSEFREGPPLLEDSRNRSRSKDSGSR